MFTLSGKVKKNLGRGKRLGYPTANIEVSLDTPEGLFLGYAEFNGEKHPSLVFIGAAITFGETQKQCEVFILDFDGDVYGKEMQIEVIKKLRDNRKFGSAEELVQQMKKDEKEAREYFEK